MKNEKEKEKEKTDRVALVIELPKPSLQPVMGRMYLKEYSSDSIKTRSGIYLPTQFTKMKGEETQEWKHKRYFVLAVASDINLTVNDAGNIRKVERGDEVAVFFHEDALRYSLPEVMDYTLGDKFLVIHETEVAGVAPRTIEPTE